MNYRNKKIRQHARGQQCTLRWVNCNGNPETVVFCHLDEHFAGKGLGLKAHDFAGFFGCSSCHYDYGNDPIGVASHDVLRAVIETLAILFKDKVIK
jgi:hypothetical protein